MLSEWLESPGAWSVLWLPNLLATFKTANSHSFLFFHLFSDRWWFSFPIKNDANSNTKRPRPEMLPFTSWLDFLTLRLVKGGRNCFSLHFFSQAGFHRQLIDVHNHTCIIKFNWLFKKAHVLLKIINDKILILNKSEILQAGNNN